MHSAAKSATTEQRKRFEVMKREIGCLACRQEGHFSYADVQHALSGGNRIGHNATYPLCPWHHRGVKPLDHLTTEQTTQLIGPSLADGSKAFYEQYGSDQELKAEADRLYSEFQQNTTGDVG